MLLDKQTLKTLLLVPDVLQSPPLLQHKQAYLPPHSALLYSLPLCPNALTGFASLRRFGGSLS